MIVKRIGIITDRQNDRRKKPIFKIGRVRLGVKVLSFHNFGNLGGQLKTRHNDALGEKRKGDLYHKRVIVHPVVVGAHIVGDFIFSESFHE